jgi:hypothetical protein
MPCTKRNACYIYQFFFGEMGSSLPLPGVFLDEEKSIIFPEVVRPV